MEFNRRPEHEKFDRPPKLGRLVGDVASFDHVPHPSLQPVIETPSIQSATVGEHPYIEKIDSDGHSSDTLGIQFTPGEEPKIFAETQLVPDTTEQALTFTPQSPRELIDKRNISDVAELTDLSEFHLDQIVDSLDTMAAQTDVIGFLDKQSERHSVANVLAVLSPEEIYKNYGGDVLAWTTANTWLQESLDQLRAGVDTYIGCDPELQRKLERWSRRGEYSPMRETRDLISQFNLGGALFKKRVLEGIDLPELIRASVLPDTTISDKRPNDYSLMPVTPQSEITEGYIETVRVKGAEYVPWLDSPLGYILLYKGEPNAVAALDLEDNSLKIVQMQRVRGEVAYSDRPRSPRGLMPLDWHRLMVSITSEVAAHLEIPELTIQSAANNTWTHRDDINGEPLFTRESAEKVYDTTAKRLGFEKDTHGDWCSPVQDLLTSTPSDSTPTEPSVNPLERLRGRLGFKRGKQ